MTEEEKRLAEEYVNERLSEKDASAFKEVILQNAELIEYVNILRIFRSGLEEYAQNKEDIDFIDELLNETDDAKRKPYFRIVSITLGVSLFFLLAFVIVQYFQLSNKIDEPPQSPPPTEIDEIPLASETNKENENLTNKREKQNIKQTNRTDRKGNNKTIIKNQHSQDTDEKELFALRYNDPYKDDDFNKSFKGGNDNNQDDIQIVAWKQALLDEDFEKAKAIMPDSLTSEYWYYELSTYYYNNDREQFHILSEEILKYGKEDLKGYQNMYSLSLHPSELQKILNLASITR